MIITIDDLATRRKSIFVPADAACLLLLLLVHANMDKGATYDYTFDALPPTKNV